MRRESGRRISRAAEAHGEVADVWRGLRLLRDELHGNLVAEAQVLVHLIRRHAGQKLAVGGVGAPMCSYLASPA